MANPDMRVFLSTGAVMPPSRSHGARQTPLLTGEAWGVARRAAQAGSGPRIRWSKADRLALAPSPMAMMICL